MPFCAPSEPPTRQTMPSKSFRFSLQSVADLREREAEQAEQQLAQALFRCAQQEAAVREAETRLQEVVEGMNAACMRGLQAVRQQEGFRRDARRAVQQAQRLLDSHRRQAEQARRVLQLRKTAQETLETLRTSEKDKHHAAHLSAEMAHLDEQALSIYLRRQSNPR